MSLTRTVCHLAAAVAVTALLVPSVEAAPKNGRGNITAVDWNAMQIAIRGVDGKVNTFRVKRDASVKFSADGGDAFPNPTLKDLAPPMYVWFVYEDWDGQQAPTIQDFDVREVPRGAGRARPEPTANPGGGQQSRDLQVRIMKFTSESRGEFKADVAGRSQTFRTVHPNMLSRWREGDLVVITVEGQNRVTNIKRAP